MRKSSGIILTACLLAATPVFAGNLSFDNGQTSWHSTQCTKPPAPPSVMGADRNTDGNDMNTLISQHNIYVDAVQNYMNCVSNEAEQDQAKVNQAIAASAAKVIADSQTEVDSAARPLRDKQ